MCRQNDRPSHHGARRLAQQFASGSRCHCSPQVLYDNGGKRTRNRPRKHFPRYFEPRDRGNPKSRRPPAAPPEDPAQPRCQCCSRPRLKVVHWARTDSFDRPGTHTPPSLFTVVVVSEMRPGLDIDFLSDHALIVVISPRSGGGSDREGGIARRSPRL